MAKVRVIDEFTTPPGDWVCHVQETDERFSDPAFSELESKVADHLLRHDLDPDTAASRIHYATARMLVAAGRSDLVEETTLAKSKRKPLDYAAGAIAICKLAWRKQKVGMLIGSWLDKRKDPFVSQQEAERRAVLCAECPENGIPADKSWLEQWSNGEMLKSVMGKTVERQSELGVCDACGGCELRAVVWTAADILRQVTPKKFARSAPAFCWKREIVLANS